MPPRKSKTSAPDEKLPLPAFLKVITSAGLGIDKAMVVASRIYKTCNTPSALGQLTDGTLITLHVEDKEHRKLVLAAVKKAGYKEPFVKDPVTSAASSATTIAKASGSTTKKPSPKKRKWDDDLDEPLPKDVRDETADYGSLDFHELLDEKALLTKSVIVNRAPVMTAWAMVVAERMGFNREEALSIASVYTEMNATSKGVKLGIFEEGKGKHMEPIQGDGQPYIDFIGRRPVFSTQTSQWRALFKGEPIPPSSAFKYITNAFHQTTGHIVGAMRLLADTYPPQELNRSAFELYAEFRPTVDGWGKKGLVKCEAILRLRRNKSVDMGTGEAMVITPNSEEPQTKKAKLEMSVEDYEAALDSEGFLDLFNGTES